MKKEQRIVCFDETLGIEAYRFIGIMQKFPNHFHEYYVLGFIEDGNRHLSCKNKEYIEQLLETYTEKQPLAPFEISTQIQSACDYMDKNFAEPISLEGLSRISGSLILHPLKSYFTGL